MHLTNEQIAEIKRDLLDRYGDDNIPIAEIIYFLDKKYCNIPTPPVNELKPRFDLNLLYNMPIDVAKEKLAEAGYQFEVCSAAVAPKNMHPGIVWLYVFRATTVSNYWYSRA